MSGRNGIAGRRGGPETASAPVSDEGTGEGMELEEKSADYTAWLTARLIADRADRCETLAQLDALAADAEDEAQYIPEGGDGALAGAMRSDALAAIDRRRALLAESGRADLLAAVLTSTREQAKREACVVSQKRVAVMCGVTVRTVKRWERNPAKAPVAVNEYTGRNQRYSIALRRDARNCEGWCKGYRLTRKRKARYLADLPTSATFNPDTLDTPADMAAERERLT